MTGNGNNSSSELAYAARHGNWRFHRLDNGTLVPFIISPADSEDSRCISTNGRSQRADLYGRAIGMDRGRISAAYFEDSRGGRVVVCYWGSDGTYEDLTIKNGQPVDANTGGYDTTGVTLDANKPTTIPPNIVDRHFIVNSLIGSLFSR